MEQNKTKVLLTSILQDSHRNLSCLSLFSSLTENNIKTKLLFLPKEKEYNESKVKEFILSNKFDLVGISLMTDGFNFAKLLTKDIKKYAPQTHVIWGGIHPTLMPEECLDYADSICRGEGEKTLLSLTERISKNQDFSDLPGIGTKSLEGKIIVNPPFPLEKVLDSLPFNRYDWANFYVQDSDGLRPFNVLEYSRYSNYNGEDYTLMATRGCPFSCSYCCNSYLNELYDSHSVRKRSVGNVIREIKSAMDYIGKIKFINFIDDQFLTNKKWNDEFAEVYKKEIGLPFIARLTPGTFNDHDIKKLKDAGMKFLQIGIQSGSEKTNKIIFHRKFNRDTIIETSRVLSQNGVHAFYDVIIQNSLENDFDRDKTIQLLLDIKKPFSLFLFTLTPFPKTELERIYEEGGIISRTNPYGAGYRDYDEKDFYFQLASIIPSAPRNLAQFFFKHSKDKDVHSLLNQYYEKTKEDRNKSELLRRPYKSNS